MTLKLYKHAPAHLLLNDQNYFITGAVYQKRLFLASDMAKDIFKKYLFQFHEKFEWKMKEWVILGNHYHFLSEVPIGETVPAMINVLHKTTAFHIMRYLNIHVKPFWYQYWDRCIRDDREYFNTAQYINYNPVKHGLIEDPREYVYSGFREKHVEGSEYSKELIAQYNQEEIDRFREVDDF